jgi:sugar lactone lactonase YvrE
MPLDFSLQPSALGRFGQGFTRPECVICTAAGDVVVSNWKGGVTHVRRDGSQRDIVSAGTTPGLPPIGTNGFAVLANGDFLLANLANDGGGVWRLRQDGRAEPFCTEVEGHVLEPANYVGLDRQGRIWITVSTRHRPRSLAQRPDVADGYIVLVDATGARVVADGLGYTNEAIVDGTGDWLYVNETFGRRTSRLRIKGDGSLGRRETVTEYGAGTYPDGLAFDEAGAVWITSVISNRVIRVEPDGTQQLILEEADPAVLAAIEADFQAGRFGPASHEKIRTEVMQSISSIAFGGPDRKTAYLGNLLDDTIYTFRSPVAGLAMAHWAFRL